MDTENLKQIRKEQEQIAKFEDTNGQYYVEAISRSVEMMVRGIPPEFRKEALEYMNVMTPRNCSAVSYWLREAVQKIIGTL